MPFTETTHLYFFFPVFAVMVVLPLRIAVTLPFLLTFATFGLDDFHFTPDFAPFNRRVCFSDTFSVMRFLLILTFASILDDIIHFLRREMLDFTAFPVFFVSNLLLVQRKKYYFNRAMVSRNCSIVL